MKRENKVLQLEKSMYVSNKLFPVVQPVDTSITNLTYQAIDGEEYVIIHRKDSTYNQKVLVTANSLGCIALEVIKKIIY